MHENAEEEEEEEEEEEDDDDEEEYDDNGDGAKRKIRECIYPPKYHCDFHHLSK